MAVYKHTCATILSHMHREGVGDTGRVTADTNTHVPKHAPKHHAQGGGGGGGLGRVTAAANTRATKSI